MELPKAQQELIALAESIVSNPQISVMEYELGRSLRPSDYTKRIFRKPTLNDRISKLEIRRERYAQPLVITGIATERSRQYGAGQGYGITRVETENYELGTTNVELILSYQVSATRVEHTFEQDLYRPFSSTDELLQKKREFEEAVARDALSSRGDWKWADVVNRYASTRGKAVV